MHPPRAMKRMLAAWQWFASYPIPAFLFCWKTLIIFSRKQTLLFMLFGALSAIWGKMAMALCTTCWKRLLTSIPMPKFMWPQRSAWVTVMECLRRKLGKTGESPEKWPFCLSCCLCRILCQLLNEQLFFKPVVTCFWLLWLLDEPAVRPHLVHLHLLLSLHFDWIERPPPHCKNKQTSKQTLTASPRYL